MTAAAARPDRAARVVRVTGVVQGVGFRPFVHRLAAELELAGWVRNRAGDVEIAVEGAPAALDAFVERMRTDAPPLARVERVSVAAAPATGARDFLIAPSDDAPGPPQAVLPDVGTCERCEHELFDPTDRRFHYPFITCTDCGPRYTVIERLPYDRERTSMRAFTQCPACAREYATPRNRRHHSETNSCATCGPALWFEAGARRISDRAAALVAAADALRAGAIVAVRGLGGFHLAVDATNDDAVRRLRERKHREAKPFAVMVRTLDDALRLADVGPVEEALLGAAERPIVLVRARDDAGVAPSVAPGVTTLGIMLAYTPLHHLLLDLVRRPLVMTSGNRGEEPIIAGVDDARRALGAIADAFLVHDREIVRPVDDSVARVAADLPLFLRRARGYAPLPLALPQAAPRAILAVGAHLKNTFTLADGVRAIVSPHLGDLDNVETETRWRTTLGEMRALCRIAPRVLARDAHPSYVSTRLAEELAGEATIVVQHHHAHIAAVMAEHGVREPVIGVAYDGTGFGDDGCVWGAELLLADLTGYTRLAHLRYAPLPGGEVAVRTPWRSAAGYLSLAPEHASSFELALEGIAEHERRIVLQQAQRGLNAPLASSVGRLFDAAAAMLGVRQRAHYEGQAAMELEALAGTRRGPELDPPRWEAGPDGTAVLDPLPTLVSLGELARAGGDRGALAASFHDAIATATVDAVCRAVRATDVHVVALGGGVFQNARLVATVVEGLTRARVRVLVPRALPPNDGAISYGQAAVAAAVLAAGLEQPRVVREVVSCA